VVCWEVCCGVVLCVVLTIAFLYVCSFFWSFLTYVCWCVGVWVLYMRKVLSFRLPTHSWRSVIMVECCLRWQTALVMALLLSLPPKQPYTVCYVICSLRSLERNRSTRMLGV
jgi:hypothetical protein